MNKLSYISLFSSAGVGCYGFKMEGYDCIATNELLAKRLDVQKCNHKCKYNSGYVLGDILSINVHNQIIQQLELWKQNEQLDDLTVLVATPPCQGMSVANHKKKNEQKRNSLVVASLVLIKEIKPKYFVLENVKAFLNTICTDIDGMDKKITARDENDSGHDQTYQKQIHLHNFKF